MRLYFACIGIVCLVAAAWLFIRRMRLVLRGALTSGQVVSFETRTTDDSTMYLPVVSFRDEAGREHRFTSVAGAGEGKPPVGSTVPVRYLRDDPEQALIVSFLHFWAAPIAFAVLGGAAVFASVWK